MKVALVNPPWSFEGSIYFGCREPDLPLEYGYAAALLRRRGHQAVIIDAHLSGLSMALEWEEETIRLHRHHHHRFDAPPHGPGAEVEASRGCPYACTFCAKENFRDAFRVRPLEIILQEIDGLVMPMFLYPGSPGYTSRFGAPDERAWERALDHYLDESAALSDLQDKRPRRLPELEGAHGA